MPLGKSTGTGSVEGRLTVNLVKDFKYLKDSITYTITVANEGKY